MGRNEFGENNVTLSLYEAKPTAEQQAFLGELHELHSPQKFQIRRQIQTVYFSKVDGYTSVLTKN